MELGVHSSTQNYKPTEQKYCMNTRCERLFMTGHFPSGGDSNKHSESCLLLPCDVPMSYHVPFVTMSGKEKYSVK